MVKKQFHKKSPLVFGFQMPQLSSSIRASPFGNAMAGLKCLRFHSNDTIYYLQTNEAYCLNRIARSIINCFLCHCSGNCTIQSALDTFLALALTLSSFQSWSFLTAYNGLNG